jgi:hypothetical protein
MAGITHWLDERGDGTYHARKNGHQHINRIRMSAVTILKLMALKAGLKGEKVDLVGESQKAEEKQRVEQW